jgi:hypothetical protein
MEGDANWIGFDKKLSRMPPKIQVCDVFFHQGWHLVFSKFNGWVT